MIKPVAKDISRRAFMVLFTLLYPFFAVVALPWAYLDSIGSWGYTTFESWKEGWGLYGSDSLKSFWHELTKPIGS